MFLLTAPKQSEPLRGPPGLTHPSSLSSSTNSSGNNHGSNQQSNDLSAPYGSSRMVAGSNMPLSGMSSESTHDQSRLVKQNYLLTLGVLLPFEDTIFLLAVFQMQLIHTIHPLHLVSRSSKLDRIIQTLLVSLYVV